MDEKQVKLGSRYLFITPTLKGVLDDYSYANLIMDNRAPVGLENTGDDVCGRVEGFCY